MATTAAKAMQQFLASIEPTGMQTNVAKGRKNSVAGYLSGTFSSGSDMPLCRTVLVGSVAQGTALRPIEDVDVVAVFGNAKDLYEKYRYDSKAFLYRVKRALDEYRVEVVGARGLPVEGGGFFLPSGDGRWIQTNPEYDGSWLDERHAALGYHLKNMAKLAKAWNRVHSSWFKSFHLEVMVATAFTSLGSNYRHALSLWFDQPHISVSAPWKGEALDSYMPFLSNRRQSAQAVLRSSAERAAKAVAAEGAGDHAEAIRLWRVVFGDSFPAYG
jgi:hypothetical protein